MKTIIDATGLVNITGFILHLNIKEHLNFIPALAKCTNTKSTWFLKARRILVITSYFQNAQQQLYK